MLCETHGKAFPFSKNKKNTEDETIIHELLTCVKSTGNNFLSADQKLPCVTAAISAVSVSTKVQLSLVIWEHKHVKYGCQNMMVLLLVSCHTCQDKSLAKTNPVLFMYNIISCLQGYLVVKRGCSWPQHLTSLLEGTREPVKYHWCEILGMSGSLWA